MKKLVAAGCCIFLLHSFSKASNNIITDPKTTGQRTLVKAIAVIVNTESNKKLPAKRIFVVSSEPPWF